MPGKSAGTFSTTPNRRSERDGLRRASREIRRLLHHETVGVKGSPRNDLVDPSIRTLFRLLVPACGSSDTGEQIEGVWRDTLGVYLEYDGNGQYTAADNAEVEEPFEWGDYTFDGETLTQSTASDSRVCPGTSVTWTVVSTDDGDQADLTFVEDSCVPATRAQDLVLIRQSA